MDVRSALAARSRLRRFGVRLMIFVAVLMLTSVPVVGAQGPQKTILTGLSNPSEVAVDTHGNVYFVTYTPDLTGAFLGLLAFGSKTPSQIFSLSNSSGVAITQITIDGSGNVYLLASEGCCETVVYMLQHVHRGYVARALIKDFPTLGGEFLASGALPTALAVGGTGGIYIAQSAYDPGSGNTVSQIVYFKPGAGSTKVVATFDSPFSSWDLLTEDGFLFTNVGNAIYEVTPTGAVNTLYTWSQPSDYPSSRVSQPYIGLDGAGNMYFLLRFEQGPFPSFCQGTSTQFTIGEFKQSDLLSGIPRYQNLSKTTFSGVKLIYGDNTGFVVSSSGNVYFETIEFTSGCSSYGSHIVSYTRGPHSWSALVSEQTTFFSLATAGGMLYWASSADGTISATRA